MVRKEHFGVLAIGLILFGQAIDSLNGSLSLPINNPFQFLTNQILTTYPLTALSVGIKVTAIVLLLSIISFSIKRLYLAKGVGLFAFCALALLYSVQQLATKQLMIPTSWTLSLAFSSVILALPALVFFLIGMFGNFKGWLKNDPYNQTTHTDQVDSANH